MPVDLPTIYARVTKAKPELAVSIDHDKRTKTVLQHRPNGWMLSIQLEGVEVGHRMPEEYEALALIGWKWLEALPMFHCLAQMHSSPGSTFAVVSEDNTRYPTCGSRLHALAEYHVPGSTKEPADA